MARVVYTGAQVWDGSGADPARADIAVEDGFVAMPDVPGIGFEAKRALYAVMRPLAEDAPSPRGMG